MRCTEGLDKGHFKILEPMCLTCKYNTIGVMKCIQFPDGKLNDVLRCNTSCSHYKLEDHLVMSSLLGFAVGDAVGVPHEFESRRDLSLSPVTDMDAFGSHNQPRGTWSDDTSLMLALSDALCEREFSLDRAALKIVQWYEDGKYTPYGNVFDIGNSTMDAIVNLKNGISPLYSGGSEEYENGNGGLMRVLPLAFYLFHEESIDKKADLVYKVCGITHNHIISKAASHIYTEFAIDLIKTRNLLKSYKHTCNLMNEYYKDKLNNSYKGTFENILSGHIHNRSIDEIKSSGYVIDTLEAVIWCLINTDNYKDAVLKCVNLGDDTDTIAALAGGLAGIAYGLESIPQEWINNLADNMFIFNMAHSLYNKCFTKK